MCTEKGQVMVNMLLYCVEEILTLSFHTFAMLGLSNGGVPREPSMDG